MAIVVNTNLTCEYAILSFAILVDISFSWAILSYFQVILVCSTIELSWLLVFMASSSLEGGEVWPEPQHENSRYAANQKIKYKK